MKTGLLILLAGSVAGWATDAKAGSSDALSDVLKAEVSQSVDRAARLADQRGLRRADPQAMWQSGWLRDGRTWRPATVAVAAPDERKLLRTRVFARGRNSRPKRR